MKKATVKKIIKEQGLTHWEEAYQWIRVNLGYIENPLQIREWCKELL